MKHLIMHDPHCLAIGYLLPLVVGRKTKKECLDGGR